jgi:hypothetical protein
MLVILMTCLFFGLLFLFATFIFFRYTLSWHLEGIGLIEGKQNGAEHMAFEFPRP